MSIRGLIAHFFLVLSNIPAQMYHRLFFHSPTEGHFGCFQVLAVMNKAAINILVQVFVWTQVSAPLGKF